MGKRKFGSYCRANLFLLSRLLDGGHGPTAWTQDERHRHALSLARHLWARSLDVDGGNEFLEAGVRATACRWRRIGIGSTPVVGLCHCHTMARDRTTPRPTQKKAMQRRKSSGPNIQTGAERR
jgi:hypothetical protein